MDDSLNQSWAVFSSFYKNFHCPFCKHQSLDFSNSKQDKIAGIDVIAVSCYTCGHIELFGVTEVIREADRIKKERQNPTLW